MKIDKLVIKCEYASTMAFGRNDVSVQMKDVNVDSLAESLYCTDDLEIQQLLKYYHDDDIKEEYERRFK